MYHELQQLDQSGQELGGLISFDGHDEPELVINSACTLDDVMHTMIRAKMSIEAVLEAA